mmetsp:Transcript_7741/g.10306  ORF Transcript_7741/g.10306 Transcript_7741/m.10306 type:complete len:83 (-) Transcript_7741:1462-1710(-)
MMLTKVEAYNVLIIKFINPVKTFAMKNTTSIFLLIEINIRDSAAPELFVAIAKVSHSEVKLMETDQETYDMFTNRLETGCTN